MNVERQVEDQLLRHTIATLVYRLGKVLRDTPASFADYPSGDERNAGRILAHIGDLMDWALTLIEGRQAWKDSTPLPWHEETARFYAVSAHWMRALLPMEPELRRRQRSFRAQSRMR